MKYKKDKQRSATKSDRKEKRHATFNKVEIRMASEDEARLMDQAVDRLLMELIRQERARKGNRQ